MDNDISSSFQNSSLAIPSEELIVGDFGEGSPENLEPGHVEPSSVDEVYTQILQRIVQGDFPKGTVLTCTRLAVQLKVSRTPIAAALDRLVADGLLKKVKNRRAIVRDGAERWLSQVHQLREIVEPPAAALAAIHISSKSLQELDRMRRAAEPRRSEQSLTAARNFDKALHISIADCCGNLPLRMTIYKCWSYKQLIFDAGHDEPSGVETGYREHVAILEALARRDALSPALGGMLEGRSRHCLR